MTTQELILTIRLDDGTLAEARVTDPATVAALSALAGPSAEGSTVRLQAVDAADTAGHMLAADSVAVTVGIDGDVQGHTLTLRLPTSEEARRLQQRLIVGGVLAASIAIGTVGVSQLAGQQSQVVPQEGAAIAAPAVRAPATPEWMKPGNIDARLRDASTVVGASSVAAPDAVSPGAIDAGLRDSAGLSQASGTSGAITPAKDAKDAKDAAILSGAGATDEATEGATDASSSNLGTRSVMPR
jgi:hypothetical protein